MQDLIQHLQDKADLTAEQAEKSIHAIKDYVVTKFPMLQGAVDNMFGKTATATVTTEPSLTDKISSAASDAGHKVGDFASTAADKAKDLAHDATEKAEEMYDSAKDKLTNIFGGKND